MFSIARFMFGSEEALAEGGNTRALVRDPETGLVKGQEQIRTFKGRQGFAEKIELRSGRITRQALRHDVIEMLKVLDAEFEREHGHPLWSHEQRDDILGSGFVFNGSSAHLFAPPETMPDEKFIEFKPVVGDIDLMVPDNTVNELFQTLNRLEDAQLTPKIAYIGHNKKSPQGIDQINALFSYTWDPQAPEGEGDAFFQIDFEFSEFESGRPTDWAKFSHSSAWRDIEAGVKGLAHKMLLFSLASMKSPAPLNARIATPTGTAENPSISMTADRNFVPPSPDEVERRVQQREKEILSIQKRKDPERARQVAEKEVAAEIKRSSKKPTPIPRMRSIDLVVGYSTRYKKLDWQHDGNEVYKYLKRSERDDATRDISKIFVSLFGENPPPTKKELDDFGSFLGTLDIMKNRLTPPEIVKTFEGLVYRLFGKEAQPISATDKQEDMSVKDKIVEVFRQVIPEVKASTIDVDALKQSYYATYKIRGEEGFAEDDSRVGDVDESRSRRINRLVESVIWGS